MGPHVLGLETLLLVALAAMFGCVDLNEADGFACSENGIRAAIDEGGGPHFFNCDGSTPVVVESVIVIDTNVVLDGRGDMILDGGDSSLLFHVPPGIDAELHGFTLTGGRSMGRGPHAIRNQGTLTIRDSTVDRNGSQFLGTAVWNDRGELALVNSTVSGTLGNGMDNDGVMTVTNSTISDNSNSGIDNDGVLRLVNTTLSGNGLGDLSNSGDATVSGTLLSEGCWDPDELPIEDVVSEGYNIESPGDVCGFRDPSDQVAVPFEDLRLAPLADNSGSTQTHALRPGSVAVDAIPESECPTSADQRGIGRPNGTGCDVGAYEMEQ